MSFSDMPELIPSLTCRYLIHVPSSWDAARGPSPIVLFHGLGLGVLQYSMLIYDLLNSFSDRPLLVPLQPHISQDIFHPRFLEPLSRHETTAALVNIFLRLGWIRVETGSGTTHAPAYKCIGEGVTVMSHSKYELIYLTRLRC